MRMVRRGRVVGGAFRLGYLAMFLALIVPLVVIVGTSFGQSSIFQFPPEMLSIRWYAAFLESGTWIEAVENSLVVGAGTTAVATALALPAAYGVERGDSSVAGRLVPFTLMPLFLPPVVLGVALLAFLGSFNLHQSYASIVVAHALWATPIAFLILQSVLTQVDWNRRDAALDLGATPVRTFLEVVLPQMRAGLFASALIAFIISLQEFVMTLFLSGQDTRTIPVLAWISISQVLDPIVSVVSTLLIGVVSVLLLAAAALVGLDRIAKQL